jgi:hypothetical protein
MLRRRRELVVLSADVQRATVIHRVDFIERNGGAILFGMAANAARLIAMRRIAVAVLSLVSRKFR